MFAKATCIAAAAALALCASTWAVAQERDPDARPQVKEKAKASTTKDRDKNAGARDKSSQGMARRGSKISGMAVKNDENKELGTVDDLVIAVRQGKVRYAALSYGGFLGVGDKLFAVPWEVFEHRRDVDSGEHTLLLNIAEETLKNAPGFNQDKWPNFADENFHKEIDTYYQKFSNRDNRRASVDVKAGRVEVKVDAHRQKAAPKGAKDDGSEPVRDIALRLSNINSSGVYNLDGEKLGEVNDLVLDMNSGEVRYAALSYGGFLGVGDKLFAVPWSAFDCRYDEDEKQYYFVLSLDEPTLKAAPGFEQDNWPDVADPKFGAEIDKYYKPKERLKQPAAAAKKNVIRE